MHNLIENLAEIMHFELDQKMCMTADKFDTLNFEFLITGASVFC